MRAIYRKVVRWIYPRYESSAWFRLAFILGAAALFNGFVALMIRAFGDSPATAAVVVIVLFAYSIALAFVLTPGDWISKSEGIGGA